MDMLQLTVGLTDTCITDLVMKQNLTKDQFFNHAIAVDASYNTAKELKDASQVHANQTHTMHKGQQ